MTEAEWFSCDYPGPMLRHLTHEVHQAPDAIGDRPRAVQPSPRKLRLFACACCRACMGASPDPRVRAAVDTAERYADGLATRGDLGRVWNASLGAPRSAGTLAAGLVAIEGHLSDRVPSILACLGDPASGACLFRDVFGNPFRPWPRRPPAAPEDWHAELCLQEWRTPTVLRLARGVYADRDFGAMPVLADALEEAGCEEQTLLRHLRGLERCPLYYAPSGGPRDCAVCGARRSVDHGWVPLRGPHARGCWALDVVLGKS